ncbi:MAG: CRISPR-associated endonuclease Cas2 [Gemmataceae bacterium]|nr:CRISPR-associated endonuclease Cas2 [Gemmata sp.]MDW8196613.1 CRISPR-associated endonuclease Cas2 [Gemmataceae bacterium]
MESYLVCYDIADPKRLRKVALICQDFGYRLQLSVFLVRISATEYVRLRSRLSDVMDRDEDQILIIPLTESHWQQMETLGRPAARYDKNDVVIIL